MSTCAAGSGSQRRAQLPERSAAMAQGVLLVGGELGERAAVGLYRDDDRVVAEAAGPSRRVGDHALDGAPQDDLAAVGPHGDGCAHVAAAATVDRDAVELAQHARDPVALVGPSSRMDAGRAAEVVDLDAGVVGDRRLAELLDE